MDVGRARASCAAMEGPVVCSRRAGTGSDQRLDVVGREDSEERWVKGRESVGEKPHFSQRTRENGAPGRRRDPVPFRKFLERTEEASGQKTCQSGERTTAGQAVLRLARGRLSRRSIAAD